MNHHPTFNTISFTLVSFFLLYYLSFFSRTSHFTMGAKKKAGASTATVPSGHASITVMISIGVLLLALMVGYPLLHIFGSPPPQQESNDEHHSLRSHVLDEVQPSPLHKSPAAAEGHLTVRSLKAHEMFTCGDQVLGWEHPEVPGEGGNAKGDSIAVNRRHLLLLRVAAVNAAATRGAAVVPSMVPVAHVDDDYCDCADGSDEPYTSACSSGGQPSVFTMEVTTGSDSAKGSQRGAPPCVLNPMGKRGFHKRTWSASVPPSHLLDGIRDCSSGSDEESPLTRRATSSSDRASELEAMKLFGNAIKRFQQKYAQGNKEYHRRATHGSTIFGPQFVENVTRETQHFKEWSAEYQLFMAKLQERLKASRPQTEQPPERAAIDGSATVTPVTPEELSHAQQLRQYAQQKNGELQAKQALIQSRGLGRYFEFFPLLGNCYNITVHEKALKGGTAIPEQYNATFRVCPFISILQRTETPEVLAAVERLVESTALRTAVDTSAATSSAADDCTEEDAASPACKKRRDDAALDESIAADREASRYTVVGHWTGYLPDSFDNITGLDILEPFRHGAAPEAAVASTDVPFVVHQYTHGEPCWGGPGRTAALLFECDTADRVLKVVENGMCRYEVLFGTPSACSNEVMQVVNARVKQARL